MHELGIAISILESVQSAARRNPGVRITKVGVKIGELAGVDVDALQFGFECMVKDTEWERLVLACRIDSAGAAMSEVPAPIPHDRL